ncbi:MAG: hypothetical protein KAR06_07375, partial [Deltaproteobacteria bacterium]|nr:hypothetical protein [Deltaproteobacteria bacterium]
KKKKIGEMEYSYPVVKPIELFLYDFISTADDHYPPPFWGPPYWGPPYMTPAYWDPYWPYYNPYYWPYY